MLQFGGGGPTHSAPSSVKGDTSVQLSAGPSLVHPLEFCFNEILLAAVGILQGWELQEGPQLPHTLAFWCRGHSNGIWHSNKKSELVDAGNNVST